MPINDPIPQRSRSLAKGLALKTYLDDPRAFCTDANNLSGSNHLGRQGFHAAILALKFRQQAKADTVTSALLFAHNNSKAYSNFTIPQAVDRRIHTHKPPINNPMVSAFQRISLEAIEPDAVIPSPKAITATVRLRQPPFENFQSIVVPQYGTLFSLIVAAQYMAYVHGSTIETALEVCMRDRVGHWPKLPDDMTMKSLNFVLASQRIATDVYQLEDRLKNLNWKAILRDLREFMGTDIRRERRYVPEARLHSYDYPECMQTTASCSNLITKAALGASRLFVDMPPAVPGTGGLIIWHDQPEPLKEMITRGHLPFLPIGRIAIGP